MNHVKPLLGLLFALCLGAAGAQGLVINEIMQDPNAVGDGAGEWFELYNPGSAPVDIDGWTLKDDGTNVHVIDAGGPLEVPAGGYLVLGNNADTTTNGGVNVAYAYTGVSLGNTEDELVLVRPDTTEADRVAWDNGATFPDPAGASMSLRDPSLDNSVGDNWCEATTPYGAGDLGTPGAANECPDPSATPTPRVISEIQGSGTASPLVGELVTVEAVVVGDFQADGELGGFFVQEQDTDADADAATSEGVFVKATLPEVGVGDRVQVTGVVKESFEQTVIDDVTEVTVLESGVALPSAAAVDLPLGTVLDLEAFEGMRVRFVDTLVVTETFNLGRFGQVSLAADERLWNPTNVEEPGSEANAQALQNVLSRILLDDGRGDQNPAPVPFGATAEDPIRGGDTVTGLEGVLDFAFGDYRVQPTGPVVFVDANPRPATPPAVDGDLTVASFNVLNYFTTLDTGADNCGPDADQGCRGADSQEEFQRQRAKILAALQALDADIVGLMELENNASASLQDLVDGLNAALGAGTYAFVDSGTIGADAIKQGLIYKPATVAPVGDFAVLDDSVDADFQESKNRPVLAQSFEATATGDVFTVAVNHLKSKGSPCDDLGDPDAGDGQGNCNHTRARAAEALAGWLATDPTGSGDPDHLVIGDLNAYLKEDPIDALEAAGFVNLIERDLGDRAYTFVFDGEWGVLDHALATADLAAKADVEVWHINADESRIYDYNTEFNPAALYSATPFRSSDHDPVLVGLDFSQAATPVTVTVAQAAGADPDATVQVSADAIEAVGLRASVSVPVDGDTVTLQGATFALDTLEASAEGVTFDRFRSATLLLDANDNGQVDPGEQVLGSTSTLSADAFSILFGAPLSVTPGSSASLLLRIELDTPSQGVLPAGAALALLLALPLGFIGRHRRLVTLVLLALLAVVLTSCGGATGGTPGGDGTTVTVQVSMTSLDAATVGGDVTVEGLPLKGSKLEISQ